MDKESIRGKQRARKLALQALYQWHMSGLELSEIDAQFRSSRGSSTLRCRVGVLVSTLECRAT